MENATTAARFAFGAMNIAGTELIFARHGRTAWNLARRYQGRSDPPISAEGEVDSGVIAEALRGDLVSRIIASPSRRAMMTAAIVGERLGVASILADQRLLEIAYGAWEGLTQTEVKRLWPDQLRQWKTVPDAMRFPGGETLAEARSRLIAFLRGPLPCGAKDRGDGGGAILIIGHAGMIRLAVLEATRAPLTQFRDIVVAHGSVQRFQLRRTDPSASPSLEFERSRCESR